jgi:hypothetical protein
MFSTYVYIHIDQQWSTLLLETIDKPRLNRSIPIYVDAIRSFIEPSDPNVFNIFGFVDGTFRRHARPRGPNQKHTYNGHYRSHGFKYQGVTTPAGIIELLAGPMEGRRHDAYLWAWSNVEYQLRELDPPHYALDRKYALFGDAAYAGSDVLMVPFKGSTLSPEQILFNRRMSSVRVSVEWGFHLITEIWKGTEVVMEQRSGLTPVGSIYRTLVILTNCYTCLRNGNQISNYFAVDPPNIYEYLRINPPPPAALHRSI